MVADTIWITDSAGVIELHLNGPNLSRKKAYLGSLYYRNNQWFSKLGDGEEQGPHRSLFSAQCALLKAYRENPNL